MRGLSLIRQPLRTTNTNTPHHVNGWGNNQQSLNIATGLKEKLPWVLLKKGVCTTPLCFKYRGHGHYVIFYPSKGLHFCIQELEPESEDDPKETKSHNEEELREKCDYCDALIGHSLVVWQLLIAPIAKEEEDWQQTNISHNHMSCQGQLCPLIINEGSSSNMASQQKLNLKMDKDPNP